MRKCLVSKAFLAGNVPYIARKYQEHKHWIPSKEPEDDGKDKAAQSLGRRGGKARAEKMSPERRAEIAKKAAEKRWKTKKF